MKKLTFTLLLSVFCLGIISAQTPVDGFRIQVLATSSQEKADALKTELHSFYPNEVYVIFEDPNYKVRIGNCSDRDEAEMLLLKVQELGYPTAWIVSTTIDVSTEAAVPKKPAEVAPTEKVMACCEKDGLTLGFTYGRPLMTGAYLEESPNGANVGAIIALPYYLPLGPITFQFNAEVYTYDFPWAGGDGFSGVAYLANTGIKLNDLPFLSFVPVDLTAQVGLGAYDKHFGTAVTGTIEFPLSKVAPLKAKLFSRANYLKEATNAGESTGWINLGAMITYDISKLF